VAQIRMRIETLAHLTESPSFDESQLGLRDVTARQLASAARAA
jgi:hypothetical protein